MAAQNWYDLSIQPLTEDGFRAPAHQDDDAVLDAWLASMSVGQFDAVMNFLMDRIYASPPALDRPVA
jgi:hypothetical protein